MDTNDCPDQAVQLVAFGVSFTDDGIPKNRKGSNSRYYLIPLRPGDPLHARGQRSC